MGLSFLAPLFLAGAAFIAAPFIIHHIRRPEREPLRFSSVLFIPNVPKEVVERRRLQHILLMLLRMAFILLLTFVFTRPFWRARAAIDAEDLPARHLILIDTSYSMDAQGQFAAAKEAADDALRDVKEGEEVALAAFGRNTILMAPFATPDTPDAGTVAAARRTLEVLQPTFENTDYLGALQSAQRMLLGDSVQPAANEEPSEQLVLHFITDFQKSGMPERHTGWKLPTSITFIPYDVRTDNAGNHALTEIAVRRAESGELRVLGKVKNWAKNDAEALNVQLFVDGAEAGKDELSVKAGNASQVSFSVDPKGDESLEGYIQLPLDTLQADNRRYFTWNPPRKKRVLVVANERPELRWPAGWFFERALPSTPDLPWVPEHVTQEALPEAITSAPARPQVIVLADVDDLTAASGAALRQFAEEGGDVFVSLNPAVAPSQGMSALFDPASLSYVGVKHANMSEARFDLLSWLDLDHEVFYPFRGARFNDFSALRFYNHIEIEAGSENESTRVIAKFDDDSPAIVESRIGDGRLVVWTFPVLLEWTNLPKNARFVPLLYETLAYLTDLREGAAVWTVGQRIPRDSLVVNDEGLTEVQAPGQDEPVTAAADDAALATALLLKQPGFFRTRVPGAETWTQVDAVNVETAESDTTPISLPEFELKMTASMPAEGIQPLLSGAGTELPGGFVIGKEYGRWLLLAVFVVILAESWYMSVLRR